MKPLVTQEGCLKCHEHQGYKVGDIRGGVSVYVPSGYSCSVVALSLNIRQGTATVELELNGALQGSNCDVSVNSGTSNTNDSFTPISVSNNDIINFHTVTQNNTGGPNVITAWLKYTEN
jgi:hypothetical protein